MKKKFNVLVFNPNLKKVEFYDVIEPLLREWKSRKEAPGKTREEVTRFVTTESRYRWWAKCEYEIIIQDWPKGKEEVKLDVYDQVMMNLEVVVDILMEELGL